MTTAKRSAAIAAGLALALGVTGAADAKKKKPTCTAKKEKAGCVIKRGKFENATMQMRIEPKPFEFSLNLVPLGVVQTKIPCADEAVTIAAGTTKAPKVGKSYTWRQSGNGFSITARVEFKSAKTATVKFGGTLKRLNTIDEPVTCAISATGTLTRK
jgi:hypothetical protein